MSDNASASGTVLTPTAWDVWGHRDGQRSWIGHIDTMPARYFASAGVNGPSSLFSSVDDAAGALQQWSDSR